MLRTAQLDYDLPAERIATRPVHPRDAARLLVIPGPGSAPTGRASPEHRVVADLPDLLNPGDLLVVNTSRVIPARLMGTRADTRGRAEGLWLGVVDAGVEEVGGQNGRAADGGGGLLWRVLIKARRTKPGVVITLHDVDGSPCGVSLRLLRRSDQPGEESAWVCRVESASGDRRPDTIELLARLGRVPLPPYIRAARKRCQAAEDDPADRDEYQCVYADAASPGSVAAPTAGLHFTRALLEQLASRGIGCAPVTLHVGPGTFKPVEAEFVESHPMHAEWCELPASTARAIVAARARGNRVVAVGTTTARTLESFGPAASLVDTGAAAWSRLLITPGHAWCNLDALLTNFHLPRSTLLALVAAALPGGVPELLSYYRQAIARGYRFYSFGDAMLIRSVRASMP